MSAYRRLLPLPVLLVLGCSGGGGGASGTFVLLSCSLGCTSGGCAINQIAENQEIVLEFNRKVDPASVGPDTFQVVKAVPGGAAPAGTWITQGRTVIFRPLLTFNASGDPIFGFEQNAPYQITVPAAPAATVIQSVAGSPNRVALNCIVTASQGVNDVVPGAPQVAAFYQSDPLNPAALLPLAGASCVPRGLPDPELPLPPGAVPAPIRVVLVFDDIMQPTSLVDPIFQTSPTIGVSIRLVEPGPPATETFLTSVPGTFTISYDFTALRTRVVFVPSTVLPGLGFDPGLGGCAPPFPAGEAYRKVVVSIAPAIFDLAGNALVLGAGQSPVSFTTKPAQSTPFLLTENFDTTARVDGTRTGALWNDPSAPGVLKVGKGGGRGLHGDLVLTTDDVTIDTGSATFLASQTLTGTALTVTNGIFEFGTVRVPQTRRLRFVGPNPLRLFVRGTLDVQGILDIGGVKGEDHVGVNDAFVALFPQNPAGGAGGAGGPDAGAGGAGGSIDPTVTTSTPAWSSNAILDGASGVGVGGPGGLGVGGGVGGLHYPPNLPPPGALPGQICPITGQCSSPQKSSGGGGGGYRTAGASGLLGTPAPVPPFQYCLQGGGLAPPGSIGPATVSAGGASVLVDPTLDPDLGFLTGGSGGAGSGVNPSDSDALGAPACTPASIETVPATTVVYQSGCGGGGGGGAGQIQAGGSIALSSTGVLNAAGGGGGNSFSVAGGIPGSGKASGGGGGSGGALLLQSGGSLDFPTNPAFVVTVKGGVGGVATTQANGGAGGDGYARIETDPAPSLASFAGYVDPFASLTTGTFVPFTGSPANFSGATSTWIDTGAAGTLLVNYESYQVKAAFGDPSNPPANVEDCALVTCIDFDDDPATPNGPLIAGVHPIQIYFQGAPASAGGTVDEGGASPWVTTLADLNSNPARFVRFTIVFDQTLATTGPLPLLLAILEVRLSLTTE